MDPPCGLSRVQWPGRDRRKQRGQESFLAGPSEIKTPDPFLQTEGASGGPTLVDYDGPSAG